MAPHENHLVAYDEHAISFDVGDLAGWVIYENRNADETLETIVRSLAEFAEGWEAPALSLSYVTLRDGIVSALASIYPTRTRHGLRRDFDRLASTIVCACRPRAATLADYALDVDNNVEVYRPVAELHAAYAKAKRDLGARDRMLKRAAELVKQIRYVCAEAYRDGEREMQSQELIRLADAIQLAHLHTEFNYGVLLDLEIACQHALEEAQANEFAHKYYHNA